MKVYVVTETRGMTYEGDTYVVGAWSSQGAAEEQITRRDTTWGMADDRSVVEIDLDSEKEIPWLA